MCKGEGSYANGCINCASLVTWPNCVCVCGFVCAQRARSAKTTFINSFHNSNMNGISVILVYVCNWYINVFKYVCVFAHAHAG